MVCLPLGGGARLGHIDRGVSEQCAQNLCGLLRFLRGEPVLDTARYGVGARYYVEGLKGKKT
jgi:hypothetical protein